MKRVLVDMHRLAKNKFNGLYIYSQHLGEELINQKPEDIDLYYYLPESILGHFGNRVQYIIQKSFDKYFHRKALGFDIWHSTTTLSWYMPASKKTKLIFTIHDVNFLVEHPELKKSNARYLRLIQKRVDRADHIIAISAFALQQARSFLNFSNKPTTIVYNGCTYITSPPEEKQPSYTPNAPFLFSIGQVLKRKNFHTIIPLLQNNNYQYVIAGIDNFGYKEIILAEALKYQVTDRVIFTGPISEEEKVWYYKNCAAFMFPSFAEGFGLPVVEAMYFGKPVFISKEASLPEVGGDVAYYFSSFDADSMIKDFTNGMLHYNTSDCREKIKAQAAKFSFKNTAKEIIKIYQSL